MARELRPEVVLEALTKGELSPYYLFYGLGEFRLERVLDQIRGSYIPESARDLNLEIFYGDESEPGEIIDRARAFPFMSPHRLIIIRKTESFAKEQLEGFLPYLDNPSELTCLIFISSKTDFKKKFYKTIRDSGHAVHFVPLKDREVVPWLRRTARDMGLRIDGQACDYLQHLVGNRSRDLYAELEKLLLRYGDEKVGPDQVKDLAIHSRIYTVFQLMDEISLKNCGGSLNILNRFLEEEDKRGGPLRVIGMLNRQMRLLWQTKSIQAKGGKIEDICKKLGVNPYSARSLAKQSKSWSVEELEEALSRLYQADGFVKSGLPPVLILENIFLALCGGKDSR
ncbi:DNA polymerase III subunit delta [Thermodesulfobacteriota bacterium]